MSAGTFRHTDLGEYSADASDLGLAPGHWPDTLKADVEGASRTELVFVRGRIVRTEGEIHYVEYVPFDRAEAPGATFRVWND